jgi:hypothetical protein
METLSTKVPGRLKAEVEQYAERIGESRSVAARELLQDGLDAQERTVPIHLLVSWWGSLLIATLFTPSSASLGRLLLVFGVLMFVGGLAYPFARDRLASGTGHE